MPDVVEPGTRLVQRYRLEQPLGGPSDPTGESSVTSTGGGQVRGATYWRAQDELLDRAVGVCVLPAGSEYAERVLAAARRAAVLSDARFLRILDAAEVERGTDSPAGEGMVYVVTEWVPAQTLTDLLADGPLSPALARELGAEITAALAAAHRAGISHLALRPENVLQTAHGQVKLAGLAVDAAACGIEVSDADEAARRDTQGAAALIYAALTGCWPLGSHPRLRAAPREGDAVCSPRQVRAGIPDDLDALVARALGSPGRHHGPPVTRVEELQQGLAVAQVTQRLLVPAPGLGPLDDPSPPPAVLPDHTTAPPSGPPGGGSRRLGLLPTLAFGLALLLGIGLAVLVLTDLTGDGGGTPAPSPRAGGPTNRAGEPLPIAAVSSFDPEGSGDENGPENDDRARLAIDGDPATAWPTKSYFDPFGPTGLKNGVGLVLDLGGARTIGQATVVVRGATSLELRVADQPGQAVGDFRVVARASEADGRAVLRPEGQVTARYVLIWLTQLPQVGGEYRGEVAEIELRG